MNDLDGRSDAAAFLGRGWSFPPQFAVSGVAMVSDVASISQSLYILLHTAPGERPMLPDYGSGLHELVFREMNAELLGEVKARVESAVRKWEPRIELMSVAATANSGETGRIDIEIAYKIPQTNRASNFVCPFYLAGEPG